MGKSANWAKARALCPPEQYGSDTWLAHYQENPDVLTRMLGDLYRVYKSEEEKAKGTANPAGGRRKSHINGNMEELWSIITPRFSAQPFHDSLDELRGTKSLREMAMRAGMDHRRLHRLYRTSNGSINEGNRRCEPTRYDLEAIAKAGRVHPAYFCEWRLMIVQDLVEEVFAVQPALSISILRSLRP